MTQKRPTTVSISEDLREEIDREKFETGKSMKDIVNEALAKHYLARKLASNEKMRIIYSSRETAVKLLKEFF